uniref:thiamine-phosphate kinase n=1 Tax=uncultured Allobacillus sp. TaxID=1638025 RepID=UPI0025922C09|nr:thiamine-phosphate kinase [uncultured Allobacillus sp.]
MEEFEFIEKIKPSYYRNSSVIKGIGDDAAVVRPPNGYELVIASDTMVENVHFSFKYMLLRDVGFRVLAANLSDLAAMGATPLYYTVNIAVPSTYSDEELIDLYFGMNKLAKKYKLDLIGGDTVSANELVITVSVFGKVLTHKKRLRSYAKTDDIVFVTGNLGEAAYGYNLLQSNRLLENHFTERHKRPTPRIDFVELTDSVTRMSLNDLSDGLASELNEIAEASNAVIEINWDDLPIHSEMSPIEFEQLKKYVLSSGEDFELVGTCSPKDWELINEATSNKLQVTPIGKVTAESSTPEVFLTMNHSKTTLHKSGYSHG